MTKMEWTMGDLEIRGHGGLRLQRAIKTLADILQKAFRSLCEPLVSVQPV
jgi:hypothetical protein